MKSRRLRQGLSLGTVLMCLLALVVILFTIVTASVSHLRVVNSSENQDHAKNLAESALAAAIGEIAETQAQPGPISVSIEGVEGTGTVTFDPGSEPRGYSTFNLEGAATIGGTRNTVVPPRTVHLVGKGQVGQHVSYVECLYYRPPFPDGLVASGPVKASALKLFAIRRDGAYAGGDPGGIPPEDSLPGNLYSNFGTGWSPTEASAQLLDSSEVSGSMGAVGTVSVDATSSVEGELLPGATARPLVDLDIPAKIDVLKPNAIPYSVPTLDPDWFTISTTPLSVSGDLDLNGSALLVEGSLVVTGAVVGRGVVLVKGDVTIGDGGSNLVAGEQTAVACTGNFTVTAGTPEGNYFKGLVYTEGEFLARDITVVGATVVNAGGNPSARGQAELENVRFIHNPGSVTVSVTAAMGATDNEADFTYAFTILGHRNADDSGYEFFMTAYVSDDHANSKNIPNSPRQWPSRTEQRLPMIAISDDNLTSQPLKDALTAWIRAYGEPKGRDFPDEYDLGALMSRVDEAFAGLTTPTPSTSVVTLNLNNLLGEWIGGTRIFLWRPMSD